MKTSGHPLRFIPMAGTATLLLGAVMMAGCSTVPDPEQVEKSLAPGQRKPGASTIMLIETPKRMREDIRYPETTQMAFFWSNDQSEWRFKLPSGSYGHAGFRFLVPHNLSVSRDKYELRFNITPASMTRHLWVGLVDGVDHPERVLVDLPMSRYAPNAKGNGSIDVKIPLRDFPSRGPVLASEGNIANEMNEGEFEWVDVMEIRMIHNGGRLPSRETIITGIRFTR